MTYPNLQDALIAFASVASVVGVMILILTFLVQDEKDVLTAHKILEITKKVVPLFSLLAFMFGLAGLTILMVSCF